MSWRTSRQTVLLPAHPMADIVQNSPGKPNITHSHLATLPAKISCSSPWTNFLNVEDILYGDIIAEQARKDLLNEYHRPLHIDECTIFPNKLYGKTLTQHLFALYMTAALARQLTIQSAFGTWQSRKQLSNVSI